MQELLADSFTCMSLHHCGKAAYLVQRQQPLEVRHVQVRPLGHQPRRLRQPVVPNRLVQRRTPVVVLAGGQAYSGNAHGQPS